MISIPEDMHDFLYSSQDQVQEMQMVPDVFSELKEKDQSKGQPDLTDKFMGIPVRASNHLPPGCLIKAETEKEIILLYETEDGGQKIIKLDKEEMEGLYPPGIPDPAGFDLEFFENETE